MAKTVFITGASSGIGRATAELFARNGWQVVATMRKPEVHQAWADQHKLTLTALDVTDEASIAAAHQFAIEKFGQIDVLVNNAGYSLNGPVEAMPIASWRKQFETNVFGLVAMTQAVIPAMRARRSGLIINISSIGGRITFPLTAAYHGTKWAVEGITESMGTELRYHGIRAKIVEPGGIRTGFVEALEVVNHPAYQVLIDNMFTLFRKREPKLPGPDGVAAVIYRAATDGKDRIRYTALPGPFLQLRKLFSDAGWQKFFLKQLTKE